MILGLAAFRMIKPMTHVAKGANGLTAKERVLKIITAAKSITAPQIMIDTEMLSGSVYRTLDKLEIEGLIKRSEKSCTAGNPVYFSLAV